MKTKHTSKKKKKPKKLNSQKVGMGKAQIPHSIAICTISYSITVLYPMSHCSRVLQNMLTAILRTSFILERKKKIIPV